MPKKDRKRTTAEEIGKRSRENVVLQCGAVLNSPHGHLSGNYLRTFDLPPSPATQIGWGRTLCHTFLYVTRIFPPSSSLWFRNGAKSRKGGVIAIARDPVPPLYSIYAERISGGFGNPRCWAAHPLKNSSLKKCVLMWWRHALLNCGRRLRLRHLAWLMIFFSFENSSWKSSVSNPAASLSVRHQRARKWHKK